MEWMNLQELKRIMTQLREENYHDSNIPTVQQNMEIALSKIRKLKMNCLKQSQTAHEPLIEKIPLFLKTEAEIINIINCMVLCDLTNNESFEMYLETQTPYTYNDYIQNIEYFAEVFHTIAFLPQFYHYSSKYEQVCQMIF